jgi:SM-20-related protein
VRNLIEHRQRRVGLERLATGKSFVDHDARGVNVALRCCRRAVQPLGREVGERADDEPGAGDAVGIGCCRDTEIDDLHRARRCEQQVGWFDIAMDDATPVRGVERSEELGSDIAHVIARKRLCGNSSSEGLAREALHHDERLTFVHTGVEDRDGIRVVDACGKTRALLKAARCGLVARDLAVEDLDGHIASQYAIATAIHDGGCPAADHGLQLVAPRDDAVVERAQSALLHYVGSVAHGTHAIRRRPTMNAEGEVPGEEARQAIPPTVIKSRDRDAMASDTSASTTATVFGKNPAVLAELMLDQKHGDPSAFRSLAELCRQAGALDEARRLYERLAELAPTDDEARALAEIFNGRPSPAPPGANVAWPTPFVRVLDFFPTDVHAEVKAMTADALPQFVASEVYRDGQGMVDLSGRVSSVLPKSKAFSRRFRPFVEAAVDDHDVAGVLGIERRTLQRYEMQLTCHGDGAFFKIHTDNGKESHRFRKISYVYYFHNTPKRFSGGHLRLFDSAVEVERYAKNAYTRIPPTDNSIVFFPSAAAHEVESVAVESGAMVDGRFSINGWIVDAED